MSYHTIYQLIPEFEETRRAERYSHRTIESYLDIYRMFLHYVGEDMPISQVKPDTVRKFFAQLPGSKKTALNYHTALSSLWRWAVQNGYAKSNVIRTLKIRKPAPPEISPFRRADLIALQEAARAGNNPLREEALILLLLDTGIRASELCEITLKDIYWVSRQVQVRHGKGDKTRIIRFSQRTLEALDVYLETRKLKRGQSNQPLFITKENKPFNPGRVRKIIDTLGRQSGVVNAYAHRFRHTFAIQFLRNGGNIYALQKLLGHTTLEMCKRYLALLQADLDAGMDKASPVKGWGL